MTQADLSQASGVSVPQIARYERGESKPRMGSLMKLAHALGVASEDLKTPASDEKVITEVSIKYSNRGSKFTSYPTDEYFQYAKNLAEKSGWDSEAFDMFFAVLCSCGSMTFDDQKVTQLYELIKSLKISSGKT